MQRLLPVSSSALLYISDSCSIYILDVAFWTFVWLCVFYYSWNCDWSYKSMFGLFFPQKYSKTTKKETCISLSSSSVFLLRLRGSIIPRPMWIVFYFSLLYPSFFLNLLLLLFFYFEERKCAWERGAEGERENPNQASHSAWSPTQTLHLPTLGSCFEQTSRVRFQMT